MIESHGSYPMEGESWTIFSSVTSKPLSLSLSVSGSKNSKDPAGRRRGERRTHLKTLKKKERRTVTRFIDEVDRGSRCTWLETDDLCKWSR